MSYDPNHTALRTLTRKLAALGEVKGAFLNGTLDDCQVYERGGFVFISDPDSDAACIKYQENNDPFASWGEDGQAIRKHFNRYGSPTKIENIAAEVLPPNQELLQMVQGMLPSEVIATVGKMAFPWEVDELSWFRRDITGRKVCLGQQNQRDRVRADASLAEQGYVVLDPQE